MACCPSIWYCTADGLVEVAPDEDGEYTPPDGWTGGGPYPSPEYAVGDCGCDETMTCGGFTYTFPSAVVITLTNTTGCATDQSVPNYYEAENEEYCSVAFGGGPSIGGGWLTTTCPAPLGAEGFWQWSATFSAETTAGPTFTGDTVQTVQIGWRTVPVDFTYDGRFEFVGANGFSSQSGPSGGTNLYFSTSRDVTGTDATIDEPLFVGTISFLTGSTDTVIGTAEVWLS